MIPSRKPTQLLAMLLVLLLGTINARASLRVVPPKVCAALLLKMLSQDRNLKTRTRGKLVVVVLFSSASPKSTRNKNSILAAFKGLAKDVKVQGLPVTAKAVNVDAGNLAAKLKSTRAGAVFVTPGLDVTSIVGAALQVGIPTMTCERKDVKKGVTLGVYAKGSHAGLAINLKAARAIKMRFDARLLRISDVLR